MLAKLYDMGVLNSMAKLSDVENKLTVAAFCRRRLAVVMCAARMAETVSAVSSPFFFSSGIQFFFFFRRIAILTFGGCGLCFSNG